VHPDGESGLVKGQKQLSRLGAASILLALVVCSLTLREWIADSSSVSELSKVAVSASHLDIALGIIRGEPFSFNLDRHVWIEQRMDQLLDQPVTAVPDFADSERIPIAYMDPGWGVVVGQVYRVLGTPIDFAAVRRVQIVLDVALIGIIYVIGRQVGLSPASALIPAGIHGVNLFTMRTVFQMVQDFSVVFLVTASLALMLAQPARTSTRIVRSAALFACGGVLLWIRSLFVLFPLGVLLAIVVMSAWKPGMKRLRAPAVAFFAGSLLLFWAPRNLQFSSEGLPFSFGRPGCFWYSFYCGMHQFDSGPVGDALALQTVYSLAPELKDRPILASWTKIDELLKPVVLGEIRDAPGRYLLMSLRRFGEALFPSFYGNYHNVMGVPYPIILAGRVVLFVMCAWILVFAARQALSREDAPVLILLLPWLYIAAVSAPFLLQGRSLMPAIDGLVIVFVVALSRARQAVVTSTAT
jgi:hypothetical protein